MERERIAELLSLALNEPRPPERLVERTCWKARAAEERFKAAAPRKPVTTHKPPDIQKGLPGR